MKVKKLLMNKLSLGILVAGLSLFASNNATAQTNITVDANAEWVGSMNCYDLSMGYLWSDAWGFNDLKASKNTTDNTITLQPNFTWNTETYWVIDGQGQKIMEAFPHVVANDLIGENITFSGEVLSNTLAAGYTVEAYISMATLLPADPWYIARGEIRVPIDETGNFTINWNTAGVEGVAEANHLEYGFIVTGVNANPANEAALGSIVITDDEPQIVEPGDNNVTLDATDEAELAVYANWFELDGTTYINGSTWGIDDLKTEVDSENNTLILYPNFSTYGEPAFTNGDTGAVVFEGNTYKQDDALVGQDVTFVGRCLTNTLAEGYDAVAFIKVFDGGYTLLNYTNVPLVGGEDFSVNVNVAGFASAAHVQYGYSVTGVNANPTQMEALGNAVVSSPTASTAAFAKNTATVYPNPATNVLNIAAEDVIKNIEVYNIMGQKVLTATPNQNTATVNVSALTPGMYLVNAVINGNVSTSRFIKQ